MLKLIKNMKKIFRITSYLIKLIIAYICACFIKLFNKNYRNVWIVSERGIDKIQCLFSNLKKDK